MDSGAVAGLLRRTFPPALPKVPWSCCIRPLASYNVTAVHLTGRMPSTVTGDRLFMHGCLAGQEGMPEDRTLSLLHAQAALSRGLQHASPLVRHATLCTLRAMLRALGSALSAAAQAAARARSASSADSAPASVAAGPAVHDDATKAASLRGGDREVAAAWDGFLLRLRAAARLRLPDLQALLALHASLEGQMGPQTADAGEAPAVSLAV